MTVQDRRRERTNSTYGIGDRVEFNNLCASKFLLGSKAIVVGKSKKRLTVKLDNQVGKYDKATDISVEPSMVDIVG